MREVTLPMPVFVQGHRSRVPVTALYITRAHHVFV
jgi:hypothetical protein